MTREYKTYPAEVIKFRRGDDVADIATNGMMHVSRQYEVLKEHKTLRAAISYLECKGFRIITDEFQAV